VAIEERVLEEQVSGTIEQFAWVCAALGQGQFCAQSLANCGWGLGGGYGALREGIEEVGNAVDEGCSQGAELLGAHCEGRGAQLYGRFVALLGAHIGFRANSTPAVDAGAFIRLRIMRGGELV